MTDMNIWMRSVRHCKSGVMKSGDYSASNNKQSFLEFRSWCMSLSNPAHLEKYVRELAEYRFEHPIISDDFKNISSMERNLKTGKYEHEAFDVDDDLMRQSNRFISNLIQ